MTALERMRMVRLYGDDHSILGAVRTSRLTRVAAALSVGGARKQYGNSATNEDAILLCESDAASFLAIADGHNGAQGAHLALNWLADLCAERWAATAPSPRDWPHVATEAMRSINSLICRRNENQGSSCRTTLSMALLDTSGRDPTLLVASIGDSHIFTVRSDFCRPVAISPTAGSYFLGAAEDRCQPVAPNCAFDVIPTSGLLAVVLASDGLSSPGIGFRDPAAEILTVTTATSQLRSEGVSPSSLAEAITVAACGAQCANQSGDNIAVAALAIAQAPDGGRFQ